MTKHVCTVMALVLLLGTQVPAQQFPPGYVDPAPLLAAAVTRDWRSQPEVHHLQRHRVWRRRWPDIRERRQRGLAAHRCAGKLHAHHQLGDRHEQGDVRSEAGIESGLMEVRTGLAGRHSHADRHPSNSHRQWSFGMAHRRRRRARGRAAGPGGPVPVGPVVEPSGLSQSCPSARRESRRLVAVGTDREGPGRKRRAAGEGARRRHHDARQIPRRRHDQFAEPDHPDQDDGQRAGARRFQHRARVDRTKCRSATSSGRSRGTHITGGTTTGSSTARVPDTTDTAASSPTFSRTSAAIPSQCRPPWLRRASGPR